LPQDIPETRDSRIDKRIRHICR